MSHRLEQKQQARAERLRQEALARARVKRQRLMRHAGILAVGVIAVTLVGVAITNNGTGGGASVDGAGTLGATTAGPPVGSLAPSFSLTDAVTGRQVTRASLEGHKTLLFFSEGVSCSPCIIQSADLQHYGGLARDGIRLVSITTDTASELAQAAGQYGIHTPLLADPTTRMSAAYGMLGHGGMEHPTQDGHAFMLLDADGRVVWHRAYSTMYVPPGELLADMGAKA